MRRVLCALALVLAVALPIQAGAPTDSDKVTVKAEKAQGKKVKDQTGEGYVYTLEGNVRVSQGETEILCENAVYDERTGVMTVADGVQLKNQGVVIEAQGLVYTRDTKQGTLSGDVRLTREEETDAEGAVTKEKFTLSCDEMVFDADKNSFVAEGNASIAYQEASATADTISYDDDKQEMHLTGSPTLNHEDQEVKAEDILINIGDDTFTFTGAEISFTVAKDKNAGSDGGDSGGDNVAAGGGGETSSQ